jgi:hypothetical protein
MEAVAIVTILALGQFVLFSIQVGSMRVKHGIKAPAVTGHPNFERMFRIQQNTMEQLVAFIPAIGLPRIGFYDHLFVDGHIACLVVVRRRTGHFLTASVRKHQFCSF